jgi:NADH-quinone oxidoreductase subunit L
MGGNQLVWGIIGLPIVGFLIQALFGTTLQKSLGKKALGFLAVLPIALAFVLGVMVNQGLLSADAASRSSIVTGPDWISVTGFRLPFEWVIDPLSMTMVLIITGIGSLIHLYSTGYMSEEREYSRFFAYLNLFIAAMLILVLGNNLALLFIGWEGVGLCSYLLIGFWYTDLNNARAANKAFIVNRIGDWSLMLGLFLIVAALVSVGLKAEGDRFLSYDQILPGLRLALEGNPGLATAIALLLFGGAAGKSAQFPLYFWLPDAMAGPTPVSALIHAATMVTSGVVLLNRMHIVFELSPVASTIVCAIGAFTAIFAALIAFGQSDIKKVLAYSTVSQLGYMFIGCGVGAYWTGMFHVVTHAFFKALLFLGAGAVIHAMAHDQDMRNYGNLRKYLPVTFITMMVGWLAISGVPLLSGAFSKEAIIGSALSSSQAGQIGVISGWIGLIVAALTALYMTRLMMLTFFNSEERWRKIQADAHHHGDEGHHGLDANHTPHEVPISMTLPLIVLAILSAVGGFFMNQNNAFEKWLYPAGLPILGEVSHEAPNLMIYATAAAALGLILGVVFYMKALPKDQGADENAWSPLRRAQRDQFGFDQFVTMMGNQGGGDLAGGVADLVDRPIIDGSVGGTAVAARYVGGVLRLLQTGLVRFYALMMLVGAVALVSYFLIAFQSGAAH